MSRNGRPRRSVDPEQVQQLRHEGLSWSQIAARLGVSVRTLRRVAQRNFATVLPQVLGAGPDSIGGLIDRKDFER